jgi:hypothetical protein
LFGLASTDDASEAALKSVRLGECVELRMKRPRNLQMHRLFWKLMETVANNQEHYRSAEEVCTAFKFAVNHCDTLRTKRGDVLVPRSISFAKCDQIQFREFFDKAVKFCVEEVIPGLNSEALEREVMELVGA